MTESLASPRLWLAFVTMLLVSGIANTFPVFFPPLLEEFGGSRAATASTVTLLWLGALYDLTGSYVAIYLVAAGLLVTAVAALAVFVRTTRARAAPWTD